MLVQPLAFLYLSLFYHTFTQNLEFLYFSYKNISKHLSRLLFTKNFIFQKKSTNSLFYAIIYLTRVSYNGYYVSFPRMRLEFDPPYPHQSKAMGNAMSKNVLTPMEIVKFFLKLQNADTDSGDVITNLKAQKLLYYAQGINLAKTRQPLFNDDFVAWQHGPVIPSLYRKLKDFGKKQIDLPDDLDLDKFSDEQMDILISVYKTYGQFSAWKLRDMTHQEAPWKNVNINDIITKQSIQDFFSLQLQQSN